jgi:hypothetical protein
MLELSDPLWNKLNDAHRDEHIPTVLSRLAASWNDEATEFLYGTLWHQGTCYGATYAAIPHLLKIAEPEENRRQRLDIAVFLAQVALDSRDLRPKFGRRCDDETLQGLPETLEGWDRKLDCFRDLAAMLEQPDRPRYARDPDRLRRYREILAIEPVNAGDLEKILTIKAEFFAALPAIRAVCEHVLLEKTEEPEFFPYLLSGIAAADGLLDIARLLNYGDEGVFACTSCGWPYEFMRFGEQIAVYAEEECSGLPRVRGGQDDKSLCDYKEGAPSRADGFMTPMTENDVVDARIIALLSLAKRAPSPVPALLVRHFAGSFLCCKCGAQSTMRQL